jgi:hypothetical protein
VEADALRLAFTEYISIQLAHADQIGQECLGQRWDSERVRLCEGKKRALATVFNELEKDLTDKSHRLKFAADAGQSTARNGYTPGPLARAYQFRNRFWTVA